MRIEFLLLCLILSGCDNHSFVLPYSDIKNRESLCNKNDGVLAFDLYDYGGGKLKPISRVRCKDGAMFEIEYQDFAKVADGNKS